MLLKRVLTAIFPCQYCFVDLNVSARIPFLSPWFWLRCTIQSQCSTIAVPSSVLLRAVGLSPSPIRLPIDAEKRRAVSGKVLLRWLDRYSLVCRLFCTSFAFWRNQDCRQNWLQNRKTEKYILYTYGGSSFISSDLGYCSTPLCQISGLPKLPPIPSDAFWGGNNAQGDEIVGTKKEIAKG